MSGTFDTIVVGKGMMGASAARHLASSGANVALIGPDEPGDWATHDGVFSSHYDNGRITRTIDSDGDWARMARRSIERYHAIESRSGIGFYTEVGCLIAGAEGGAYLGHVDAAARSLGVAIAHLDQPGLRSRFPSFSFRGHERGIFEARDAGHVNPLALVAAETVCAAMAGASVISREVTSLVETADGVTVTTIDGAAYQAENVLVATGGFALSDRLLRRTPALQVMARTVLFAEVAEADRDRLSAMPSLIRNGASEADSFYLLPPIRYPDGKTYIKIGGDPDDLQLRDEAAIRSWFRSGGRAAAAAHLARHLADILPDFMPASTHFSPCVVSLTETGYPYIGYVESDRVALLTGGNGMAAKSCDEIGRLGASLILDGKVDGEGYSQSFAPVFA
ncbi:glycine/D-amino acid oxidase-like deaminating enzyme [Rhizobium sp. PP-F2F-G48]|uniref:NAD(P)/FAD-dependent oxidoreductase n=1 Tax=Rhizobium sp. PP-F2F-G48 TaxID=2135651 RepID=UPI0010539C9B|nr:FAD-dependent oxidoreductase [Rhizobium sp. PP-F2F-G48]TCM58608.1 glycine/D-amino acid oxidase-like deaminating enzyme [Rhizobium sp. PP-F2F-G48]